METASEKTENKIITMEEHRFQAIRATIKYLKRRRQLDHVKNIGLGYYGAVVELKHPQMDRSVAAKIVLQDIVSESETKIWPLLSHENLLLLLSVEHIPSTCSYVFITPQHTASLYEIVEDPAFGKSIHDLDRASSWVRGICNGLNYLHERKLCHLDIKLSNVLISDTDAAIICDFGSLCPTEAATNRYVSPFMYRPPEGVMIGNRRKAVVHGFQYDVYTIGILCLELVTKHAMLSYFRGKLGSIEHNWVEVLYPKIFEILQKKRFLTLVRSAFPMCKVKRKSLADIRDFIRGCININPEKRPTIDDMLEHKFLGGEKKFRKFKNAVWSKKSTPNKLQFMVSLYISRAVRLEFSSNVFQINLKPAEEWQQIGRRETDQIDSSDDNLKENESVVIKSEDTTTSCNNRKSETIAEIKPANHLKEHARADESVQIKNKDTRKSCENKESETTAKSKSADHVKDNARADESVHIKSEDTRKSCENEESETIAESKSADHVKENARADESVHIKNKDTRKSCENEESETIAESKSADHVKENAHVDESIHIESEENTSEPDNICANKPGNDLIQKVGSSEPFLVESEDYVKIALSREVFSYEKEIVARSKKEKFFDWVSEKKLGLSKGINRLFHRSRK